MQILPSFRIFLFLLFLTSIVKAQKTEGLINHKINQDLKHETVSGFIENKGQIKDENGKLVPTVLFEAHTNGIQIFVTKNGLTYVLSQQASDENNNDDITHLTNLRIDENLVEAFIQPQNIELIEKSNEANQNVFNSSFPNGIYGIHEYKKIRIKNIYQGIDWLLTVSEEGFKYNFEVAAGADISKIKLQFVGQENLKIKNDGSLLIESKIGDIGEENPISNQLGENRKTNFLISANSIVTFNLENYDAGKPIEIDPTLVWGTLFGGLQDECFNAIATDNYGNKFVTGFTRSTNFPVQNAGTYYSSTLGGNRDVVICKFGPLNNLLWSTHYGGTAANDIETGRGIICDAQGNIFVTGYTYSANFPVQNGGGYFNPNINDSISGNFADAFLLKFTNGGTRLFATFVGGSNDDFGFDLEKNNNGDIYMVGQTSSADYPTLAGGGYMNNIISGDDGFLTEFSNTGNMLWSTFFGGANVDAINSVSVDNNANIFISGTTNSSNFPLQSGVGYFDGTLNYEDAFISKFNAGHSLLWSTFY